jgi:hypothetical protein
MNQEKSSTVFAGSYSVDLYNQMPIQDWLTLLPMTQRSDWLGQEVLGYLIVRFSNDSRGLRYRISLEFQISQSKKITICRSLTKKTC